MATLSTAQPDSSVSKFAAPSDPEAQETAQGTDYSDPDSAGEPSIMVSQAQLDAAGAQDAQPGDTFTVKITITDSTDDGYNVELQPGSAMKEPPMGESMDDTAPAKQLGKNSKIKGPGDFGMPEGLGQSPTILNA